MRYLFSRDARPFVIPARRLDGEPARNDIHLTTISETKKIDKLVHPRNIWEGISAVFVLGKGNLGNTISATLAKMRRNVNFCGVAKINLGRGTPEMPDLLRRG